MSEVPIALGTPLSVRSPSFPLFHGAASETPASPPVSPAGPKAKVDPVSFASNFKESRVSSGIGAAGCDEASSRAGWKPARKMVLVMVGLPARGKSYITKYLMRQLQWHEYACKEFNAGNYRRKLLGAGQNAKFFDPTCSEAAELRKKCAMLALDDLLTWLRTEEKSYVGIFDATNSTQQRRQQIISHCQDHSVKVVFIESICTDPEVLEVNYKLKLCNDDYKEATDQEKARRDFLNRVAEYEKVYETIEDDEDDGRICYIKIYNVGEKVVQRMCSGFLLSHIASSLGNMHNAPRKIWLTRHGESDDNVLGKLGGDAALTDAGRRYAVALSQFVSKSNPSSNLVVLGSYTRRAAQTVEPLRATSQVVLSTMLNDLHMGPLEGFTRQQFQEMYPEEHENREKDKLRYRFPYPGESYLDVIQRLKPVVMELDRQRVPSLVVAHKAVVRTILAYFTDGNLESMPSLDIPLHTVVQLDPAPYGTKVSYIKIDIGDAEPQASSSS